MGDDTAHGSLRVLAVGAHPDDVEFGCGGALLRHVARGDSVTLVILSDGERGGKPEVRIREQSAAADFLGASLVMLHLPDGELGPAVRIVELLEPVIATLKPDIVYTHDVVDSHQDHIAAHHAVRAAARNVTSLLLFESPRSLLSTSSIFIDVSPVLDKKIALLANHASQGARSHLIDGQAVRARAMTHGLRCGLHFAEAFEPVRFEWRLDSAA
jgi:LmbE family N-acetylglucosaminyl deacetylase